VPRIVLSDHPAQALPSDASYRVAEGGLEHVALYRAVPFVDFLRGLAQSHLVVGAAAEGGEPFERLAPPDRPVALILGNEEDGLPRTTRAACQRLVTIPGAGAVQSLNVAASAAILIHALYIQHPAAAARSVPTMG
jgi:TrmH RNA methyltransferase